jgi:hypothetical protein
MILRAAVSRWLLGLVRLFVCLSSQESQRSQRRNSRVSRTSHSEESELLPLRTKIKFADSHACFRLDGTVGVGDGGAVGNRLTAYSMGSSSREHAESMLWEMAHMDQTGGPIRNPVKRCLRGNAGSASSLRTRCWPFAGAPQPTGELALLSCLGRSFLTYVGRYLSVDMHAKCTIPPTLQDTSESGVTSDRRTSEPSEKSRTGGTRGRCLPAAGLALGVGADSAGQESCVVPPHVHVRD